MEMRLASMAAFLVAGIAVHAQEIPQAVLSRGPSDSQRVSSLNFERILNTFLWKNDLFYSTAWEGVSLNFRQHLRSRLIRSEQRSIQDELIDSLDVASGLGSDWFAQAQLRSSVLSDNRSTELGRSLQHKGLVGVRYAPGSRFMVSGMAGFDYDAQQDEQDQGFSYLLEAGARGLALEEFRASFASRWMQSFLSPRRPGSGEASVSLVRDFGGGTVDSMVVEYSRQKREFYTKADGQVSGVFDVANNIFQREVEGIAAGNYLTYQPGEDSRVTLETGVFSRTIDRGLRYKILSGSSPTPLDIRIQELQLFGTLSTGFRVTEWLSANLALSHTEREERHSVRDQPGAQETFLQQQERSERRLDNIARRTSLASQLRTSLSQKDQLNFAGSASILRYDTPDTLNIDDRDELLMTFGMESIHRITSELTLRLEVGASLSHLVYLHRLQSANNNWNRILRFSPAVLYAPSGAFRTVNQAEVLANYTVYDFEEQAVLTRSFSFRQASWLDSTQVQIAPRLSLNLVAAVRVYERGVLMWTEFRERPQNYFVEQTYWPQFMMTVSSSIRLGIGYRWFSQDRYQYRESERVLERRLNTSGPTVFFRWEGLAYRQVSVEGWRETQMQDGQVVRTVPNLSLNVSLAL
jgi:hypothetical protein